MRLSRLLVLSLLSGAVVAQAAASEEASASGKKHKAHKPAAQTRVSASSPDGYRELLADKMPIGSSQWWEQMRREGRLGGETP